MHLDFLMLIAVVRFYPCTKHVFSTTPKWQSRILYKPVPLHCNRKKEDMGVHHFILLVIPMHLLNVSKSLLIIIPMQLLSKMSLVMFHSATLFPTEHRSKSWLFYWELNEKSMVGRGIVYYAVWRISMVSCQSMLLVVVIDAKDVGPSESFSDGFHLWIFITFSILVIFWPWKTEGL